MFCLFTVVTAGSASGQDFAPLPAQAKPPGDDPKGYHLQKVGKNGYVVIKGFVQATFVVTPKGVVLIDAPPAFGDKLAAAIKSVTNLPVTHVILTHSHFDHLGGATSFTSAKLVAHALTAQVLSIYPDPKRPTPTITFPGNSYTLTVGGEKFSSIPARITRPATSLFMSPATSLRS